jgi:hypothetical protein
MKNLICYIAVFMVLTAPICLKAQQHEILFQQCYGGSQSDGPYTLLPKEDGIIMFAATSSSDGDVGFNHGIKDFWLVKTGSDGQIEWGKTYGGSDFDWSVNMLQAENNGYLLFGSTFSDDGDVSGLHGGGDFWLVRTDSLGNLLWQKCLGGSNNDRPEQMIPAHGGGYIGIGSTCSVDGDISHLYGAWDAWVVRVSEEGTLLWEKTYGGSGQDYGSSITATADGGYMLGATISSTTGYVNCEVQGLTDICDASLIKIDSLGEIEWQQCYGGSDYDALIQIKQTTEGGYVFMATTRSTDGDVSGFHGPGGDGNKSDLWVVKLDASGTIAWQRCLGGYENEQPGFLALHPDGGYLIGGNSNSVDGDINCNASLPGTYTGWLVKLDASGEIAWQRCLGSQVDNNLKTINIIDSEHYLIGATTRANGGDVDCDLKGQTDIWLVELMDTLTGIQAAEPATKPGITARPNPAKHWVSFDYQLAGKAETALLEITDTQGRQVHRVELSDKQGQYVWDTRQISTGIYYYTLKTAQASKTGKLVIER